jgi:hypothetical protein
VVWIAEHSSDPLETVLLFIYMENNNTLFPNFRKVASGNKSGTNCERKLPWLCFAHFSFELLSGFIIMTIFLATCYVGKVYGIFLISSFFHLRLAQVVNGYRGPLILRSFKALGCATVR